MIVKRYVVKDMPEALTKIRQDLGHNAVILSSKKIKQRGFLGIFSVSHLEVVAAVNDAAQNKTPKKGAETHHEKQPISAATPDVLREVKELREVLAKFLHQNHEALPDSVRRIRTELLENDVAPDLVETLIVRALQENNEINLMNEQEFRHILTNLIEKEINDSFHGFSLSAESQVVAFVGPTGVGKTTTIAKIAAVEILKNKRKVGFITTDTFRIAAVEQLKIYANILQVPVEVVFSSDEIEQAFEKLQDRDLILIDTAGRNYGSVDLVDELSGFLQASQPDETCLVLSLTTKTSDLEKIVGNFEGVSIDKFIFTKLDETNSYGAIYNLIHRFRKPLAYLTHGQNVPDDIETATPDRIARLVMGEKQYV
jgi:flagellar biosynthesis protein FlhF